MSKTPKSEHVSRRRFAAAVVGAGVAAPALTAQQQPPQPQNPTVQNPAQQSAPNPNTSVQRRGTRPEIPPFDGPIEFTRKDVTLAVHPFPMSQVKLLPSFYKDAEEWNRGYMSRLGADRLLYNFRANAGLPTGNAKPLGTPSPNGGSWEQPANGRRNTELRGHFTGHFLSASALLAANGDKEAKAKGDELVAELAKCQDKLGGGYLSAFPMELFDRLATLREPGRTPPPRPAPGQEPTGPQLPWAPFYTVHKIIAGMFDMYRLAGNKQALEVAGRMADWADKWTASKSEEHMQSILETEYGGMAETLYDLAAVADNDRWAKAGDRYTKKRFFNPLASRRDELRGLHVNTHIPQVIGAARRYEISGDMRFHDVADFFFYEVATARSYVTSGTSNGEGWNGQPRQLAAELKTAVSTQECCCSYNMLKLARHLYSWQPDPAYFDYYERSLLNMRIGTIRPKTGWTQYYLSLTPGAWKTFNNEDNNFWCCTGTGVEEYAKLNDSIYWRDNHGLYVNLFIPSELNWSEKGFRLRQENKFPEQQSTTLTVTADTPVQLSMRLRIPSWLDSAPTVKLNGRALEATADPGSYLTLTRTWRTGDKIEMALPMRLTMEATPDDRKLQAFLYGPLVLAGDLGTEGLKLELIIGVNSPRIGQAGPIEVPSFHVAPGTDPSAWIKPAGAPLTFRTTGQPKDVTLMPINSIFDRRYSVYWQVS